MRTDIKLVKRTYATWEELDEVRQHEELENAYEDQVINDMYWKSLWERYEMLLDDLAEKYNIDFEVTVHDKSRAIKTLDIKFHPFYFKIDKLYFEDDTPIDEINLLRPVLEKLNTEFLEELNDVISDYDCLFYNQIFDELDYETFIIDSFINNDYEFLLKEEVINI